jgi:flagellar basal-body rod protein FlgB
MDNIIRQALFSQESMPALAKSLDACAMRNRAIANNLANVNTPGYKRVEVEFESELRKALDSSTLKGARTDEKHLPIGRMDLTEVKPKSYLPDDPTLPSAVNNVDVDIEAAKLAENQMLFNFGVKYMNNKFVQIKGAITGRSP